MFNPHQFIKPNPTHIPSTRLVLQKMTEYAFTLSSQSKSRWDQPITVPDILYMKFKLPIPSSNNTKQSKIYPLSLIDFIKRAYDKCRDESQVKQMENELKMLLAKYEASYNAVSWQSMPIPNVGQLKKVIPIQNTFIKQLPIKKQTVNVSKQHGQNPYQTKIQEDIVSKTKMKLNKTLQKLQEKLNKKEQGKSQATETKTFVGFSSNKPQNYKSSIRSQINPHLRVILNPPPPPPTTQTLPKFQNISQPLLNKKSFLEQKFSKSNQKPNPITVVTSVTPEPISSLKNYSYKIGSSDTSVPPKFQAEKQKNNKIVVSRKELNQISKVAQKVSNLHQVAKRYESFNKLKTQPIKSIQEEDYNQDNDDLIIVGKNMNIDKPYLRITGRPDPELVRPDPILKKALVHFLQEFKKGTVAYDVFISQMKSIRQDLTVQHIRNSFTVQVYEENFKISLFENDIIQVKHCQANLWEFYREGLYNTKESRAKFISYNFLTLILEEKYKELEYMLTLLPEGSLESTQIQESLKLKKILMLGNYRAFFDHYNQRDQISRQLLNFYIDKVRMRCIVMFSKTCGQKITFSLLGQTIGEDEDVIQALACGEGAIVRQEFFMLKQSYQKLAKSDFLVTKKVTNLLV